LYVVTVFFDSHPLLPLAWCPSSTCCHDSAVPRLMLLFAARLMPPLSLLAFNPRALMSLPAITRTSPAAAMVLLTCSPI